MTTRKKDVDTRPAATAPEPEANAAKLNALLAEVDADADALESMVSEFALTVGKKGVPCPGCGAPKLRCISTRRRDDGVLRVRECSGCRRRIRTLERQIAGTPTSRSLI